MSRRARRSASGLTVLAISDCSPFGASVQELRVDFGPGYRVYSAEGWKLIVLRALGKGRVMRGKLVLEDGFTCFGAPFGCWVSPSMRRASTRCNLRASRSFPFASKVYKWNLKLGDAS